MGFLWERNAISRQSIGSSVPLWETDGADMHTCHSEWARASIRSLYEPDRQAVVGKPDMGKRLTDRKTTRSGKY
jgi:hypothetical protein